MYLCGVLLVNLTQKNKQIPDNLIFMNYYNCDNISWKNSLKLLKYDTQGQRLYSNLWQMTRDVLFISIALYLPLGIFIAVISLASGQEFPSTITDVLGLALIPFSVMTPFTWLGAYFGWYKNQKKISNCIRQFITSLPEAEKMTQNTPLLYSFLYKQQEFSVYFEENQTAGVSVGVGKIVLVLNHPTLQENKLHELFNELIAYLGGKISADFGFNSECQRFKFDNRPMPSAETIRNAIETMLYSRQRFLLRPEVQDQPSE